MRPSLLSSGGSVIDLDPTFLIQIGIFFLTLLVLRVLVFRPLIALFDARTAGIEGARQQAHLLTKEAEEKADDYEEQLRKVKLQAAMERDRLRADGQRLERALLEKVREQTRKLVTDTEARLSVEREMARKELQSAMPRLAADIVAKIMPREVV
ncbi:MAG: ATP synthase F0 subunit B [Myxococcales bacterium]|nr:ATP synthase F0 subunit B [Myxococcales bacterium]